MPDIIVTTPKGQMANAAQEAADCVAAGGGEYFRRFPVNCYPVTLRCGGRVYYVEDGRVRGFAVVDRIQLHYEAQRCDTTGRDWPPGVYVFMRADSWRWINPIPMRGFQGFRYCRSTSSENDSHDGRLSLVGNPSNLFHYPIDILGGWRDPRPEVSP